jgi:hypothetical protein
MASAGLALAVTLAIEVPLVVMLFPGQRVRMAVAALVANTVTNLTLNLLLPTLPVVGTHHVLVGELVALIGEAIVYVVVSRPLDVGRALVASGLGNALSFGAGGALASALLRLAR